VAKSSADISEFSWGISIVKDSAFSAAKISHQASKAICAFCSVFAACLLCFLRVEVYGFALQAVQ
jgi:hypothetical protein